MSTPRFRKRTGRLRKAFGALSLLPLVLMACGTSTPSKQAVTFPSTQLTITVWDTVEPTKLKWMQDTIIPAYQKLHPNITINYQQIPQATLEPKEFVTLGNGTAADVMTMAGYDLPVVYPKNVLSPAEDQDFNGGVQGIVNSYLPGLLSPLMYNGKLYGLPVQMNSYSLAENNSEFAAAGLDPIKDAPKTWDDLLALSKKLTKTDANGHVVQKGFDWRFTAGDHWLTDTFNIFEYQLGGQIFDAQGNPTFNDPNATKAMELIKELTSPAPSVSHNSSASPYADFASGQDAMALGGPNMGSVVDVTNPQMVGNYTYVAEPQLNPSTPANYSYSFDMIVNGSISSDKQRVAWDFTNFALSNSAGWFNATRMLQPHVNWYQAAPAKDTQGIAVFVHDLAIAKPAPRTPLYIQYQTIIASSIQKIVLNGAQIQSTLEAGVQAYKLAQSQA